MSQNNGSRTLAIKVCFAKYLNSESTDIIINQLKITEMDDSLKLTDFSKSIIDFCQENTSYLDGIIAKFVKKVSAKRISILERIFLRVSISELLLENDITPEDTIDHYMDISKEFISEDSIDIINGTLNALYKDDDFYKLINTK